ncbi:MULTISPECIES: Uma2 family endonuclease [unclassified Kribbella]|uniref:Uma2 family endonuclease n=1 Tax=unclassified Kribbella TaxID=2644121 RepID=UPI003016B020
MTSEPVVDTPHHAPPVPRDGRRYEVVDGRLLVTGAQPPAHHAAVVALMILLKQACPPDLLVAVNSLDFRPTRTLSLCPDLLVCRREDAGPQLLTRPPLLAVEVLSPSTHTTDVVLKRTLYETHAVPSYWLLDPTHHELTVLDLTPTGYTCQAVVQAEEAFQTTTPFPVTLNPAQLTG